MQTSIRKGLKSEPYVLSAILIFCGIRLLASPVFPPFRDWTILSRYGTLPLWLVFLPLIYLGFRCSFAGGIVPLSFTLLLFIFPLAGLWESGMSESVIVGGLLPYSDAHGYYMNAQRLLTGSYYTSFAARRPLFTGFLALLLWVSNNNLQITLSVMTVLAGLCCFLAAREIQNSFCSIAAALFTFLAFMFYRRFIGTTLSENLGLPLGMLGFSLVWGSLRKGTARVYLWGIFVITLALIARAGPFFILPLLMMTGAINLVRNKKGRIFFLLIGFLLIIAGFGVNAWVAQRFGTPDNALFGNFSYSLYGIVKDDGWDRIFIDHPEVSLLAEPQQSKAIYGLAIQTLLRDPLLALQGMLHQYVYFFTDVTWFSIYSYASGDNIWVAWMIHALLFTLNLVAVTSWWKHRRDPHLLTALAVWLGVILSIPFVPPSHTHYLRAYAGAIPWIAALPAIGLSLIIKKFQRLSFLEGKRSTSASPLFSILTSGLIVCLAIFGPFLAFGKATIIKSNSIVCPPGSEAAVGDLSQGSILLLHSGNHNIHHRVPDLAHGIFRMRVHGLPGEADYLRFEAIPEQMALGSIYDQISDGPLWVLIPFEKKPSDWGSVLLCGRVLRDEPFRDKRFFEVDQLIPISH